MDASSPTHRSTSTDSPVIVMRRRKAAPRCGMVLLEVIVAIALLEAVSLWPRADLDRHLGDRAEGRWDLRIDRPSPTLYTVVLRDSTTRSVLIATSIYRAAAPDAP